MEQPYLPRKQNKLTNLTMKNIYILKNSSVTIKKKIMSTHTNTNKALYIARPKKADNISCTEQDGLHANKLSGKPYIAYPKNGNYNTNVASEELELQEGLYIAYPRQEETAEERVNSFSRIIMSENYLGLPERPRWSTRKGYSLSVYSSLFKNRWSINTLCQLFKARVS